jgi:hypothetical protein
MFDSDNKFQKFIIFCIDYVFIINEHIINKPCVETTYDLNDELSIFIFNLMVNIFSVGIVSIVDFHLRKLSKLFVLFRILLLKDRNYQYWLKIILTF